MSSAIQNILDNAGRQKALALAEAAASGKRADTTNIDQIAANAVRTATQANAGGTSSGSKGTNTTKSPYKNIYDQYAKQQQSIRDAYQKQLDSDQQAKAGEINAQYDSNNTRNYINYMQAKKNLPSELSAAGINGGATESSILRLGTNYGTNVADNESGRAANLAALAQTYATKKAEYDEEFNNKLQSAYLTMLENQTKYEQEQREKDLQYFANSITGRFGDVSEYKALIKKLKASSDPNKKYKIALAQQAMNALKKELKAEEEAAKAAKSSGGGGGYRSYGGYSYGGGGSGGNSSDSVYVDPTGATTTLANGALSIANALGNGTNKKSTIEDALAQAALATVKSAKPKNTRNIMGNQFMLSQFQ